MSLRIKLAYILLLAILLPLSTLIYYPKKKLQKPNVSYERVFTYLYLNGTYAANTSSPKYISMVQNYINDPDINTIVALGCVDEKMLQSLEIPISKTYTCYDVVPNVIFANNAEYSSQNIQFIYIESLKDLPANLHTGDLLLVNDFLQYWPNYDIKFFLHNVSTQFKYSLIKNVSSTNESKLNANTEVGKSRPLNLHRAPFNICNTKEVIEHYANDSEEYTQILFIKRAY